MMLDELREQVRANALRVIADHGDYLILAAPDARMAIVRRAIAHEQREVLRCYLWRGGEGGNFSVLGEQDPRDLLLWARHNGMMALRNRSDPPRYSAWRSTRATLESMQRGFRTGRRLSLIFWDGGEHICHVGMDDERVVSFGASWELYEDAVMEFTRKLEEVASFHTNHEPPPHDMGDHGPILRDALELAAENLENSSAPPDGDRADAHTLIDS